MSELAILLGNVVMAAQNPDIGFEDTEMLLDRFLQILDKFTKVKDAHLERCLWACNLLDEKGLFWHPSGKSFDEFVSEVIQDGTFNKQYNLIKKATDQE